MRRGFLFGFVLGVVIVLFAACSDVRRVAPPDLVMQAAPTMAGSETVVTGISPTRPATTVRPTTIPLEHTDAAPIVRGDCELGTPTFRDGQPSPAYDFGPILSSGVGCPQLWPHAEVFESYGGVLFVDLDARVYLQRGTSRRSCDDECLTDHGAEVWWYSHIDGELARTALARVGFDRRSPLTPGTHFITATVAVDGLWASNVFVVEMRPS